MDTTLLISISDILQYGRNGTNFNGGHVATWTQFLQVTYMLQFEATVPISTGDMFQYRHRVPLSTGDI
jgi:hypothetical protein